MKKMRFFTLILLIISFCKIQAQYLSIDTNAPSTNSHLIINISTVTFNGGNLIITPQSGITTNYPLNNLIGSSSKLYFTSSNLQNNDFSTERNNFLLFPNPVKEILYLNSKTQNEIIESVEIWNVLGKLMLKVKPSTDIVSINVSFLENGIYFCKLNTSSNRESLKFIKM